MLCSSEYEALSLGKCCDESGLTVKSRMNNCFLMSATYKRLSSEMTDLVNNPPSASEREEMVQRPGNYHLLRPRGDAALREDRCIVEPSLSEPSGAESRLQWIPDLEPGHRGKARACHKDGAQMRRVSLHIEETQPLYRSRDQCTRQKTSFS